VCGVCGVCGVVRALALYLRNIMKRSSSVFLRKKNSSSQQKNVISCAI
jgi:hypothetical protein